MFANNDETSTFQIHGGLNLRELQALGLKASGILDFSVNINPLGPPPQVLEALRNYDPSRYPDPEGSALRESLAQHLGIGSERILISSGATELIHLLPRSLLQQGDKVAILAPTFGEYEAACKKGKAQINYYTALDKDDFRWNLSDVEDSLCTANPGCVWLCNPNNPTGVYLRQKEVTALVRASEQSWFIVDEAFLPFVDNPWGSLSLLASPNVVLLRSMTKDYALAGLRLGYLLASEEIVKKVKSIQPPWSVNGAALVAGVAALQDPDYMQRTRECIRQAKQFLLGDITRLGFRVIPSAANFLLVQVKNASETRLKLLKKGIHVRDCTSFGLPDFIRLGVRTLPECEKLIQVLEGEDINHD